MDYNWFKYTHTLYTVSRGPYITVRRLFYLTIDGRGSRHSFPFLILLLLIFILLLIIIRVLVLVLVLGVSWKFRETNTRFTAGAVELMFFTSSRILRVQRTSRTSEVTAPFVSTPVSVFALRCSLYSRTLPRLMNGQEMWGRCGSRWSFMCVAAVRVRVRWVKYTLLQVIWGRGE